MGDYESKLVGQPEVRLRAKSNLRRVSANLEIMHTPQHQGFLLGAISDTCIVVIVASMPQARFG